MENITIESASNTAPKTPVTPISLHSKKLFLQEIKTIANEQLKAALVDAALNPCIFPEPLYSKLIDFQSAYQKYSDDPEMQLNIKNLIIKCIDKKGINDFRALLDGPINNNNWKSHFIDFLIKKLNIDFNPEPIVELAIHEGKIYWHIIRKGQEVNNKRQVKNQGFEFKHKNCIHMTWEQFRIFKDTGKRYGTVAITQQRFVSYFKPEFQEQAAAVWQELKNKGILNAKARLCDSWQDLANLSITLDTILQTKYFITHTKLKEKLKSLRGTKNDQVVSRQRFIDAWEPQFRIRAGKIWDKLKTVGVINDENKVVDLKKAKKEYLNDLRLNYTDVVDSLYEIANNNQYHETITEIQNAIIGRPHRIRKNWDSTGLIENDEPKNTTYCTKLWDVATKGDQTRHRNTVEEEKSKNKLNYDHIPSADALRRQAPALLKQYEQDEKNIQTQLEQCDIAIKNRENDLSRIHGHFTRQIQDNDAIFQDFLKQKSEILNHINLLKIKKDFVALEIKQEEGDFWWTVAIPEKLHKQGETFLQSSSEQKKQDRHPFLSNVEVYLDILEKRTEDFNLTADDYLKALAAFRHLYRRQRKESSLINGQYRIGLLPQTFFNKLEDLTNIDKLIADRLQRFIERKEGYERSVLRVG